MASKVMAASQLVAALRVPERGGEESGGWRGERSRRASDSFSEEVGHVDEERRLGGGDPVLLLEDVPVRPVEAEVTADEEVGGDLPLGVRVTSLRYCGTPVRTPSGSAKYSPRRLRAKLSERPKRA